jgi:hypothetical protein
MKIGVTTLALLLSCTSVSAFAPSITNTAFDTKLNAQRNDESVSDKVKGVMASTFMAAALWASPAAVFNNVEGPAMFNDIRTTVVADAKEMASGSGSRVNKDPESLLRLGLPIPKDKEVSHTLLFVIQFIICQYNLLIFLSFMENEMKYEP